MPPPHPDAIADCVFNAFHALPTRFKPRRLADGRREWVPLAGIVLSRASKLTAGRKDGVTTPSNVLNASEHTSEGSPSPDQPRAGSCPKQLTCAALATGMKCLPQSKLSQAKGNVLHDWHAEVLAIRGFNRFLVDECADLARGGFKEGAAGAWVRWRRRGGQEREETVYRGNEPEQVGGEAFEAPFELNEDVTIHMYCSEAPCGDASMELVMAEQEDSTPWTRDTKAPSATTVGGMLGRGHFDQLGIVRRKPARPDAPITLSKTCSDKLAMKQCTSLLSAVTSLLVWSASAYLSTLVLPEAVCVPVAIERAFGVTGRMTAVAGIESGWSVSGYAFKPFKVETTSREFEFSKRTAGDVVPSNLSALATTRTQEVLINGVLQGRKQFDAKGASCASRRRLWDDVVEVASMAGSPARTNAMGTESYGKMKDGRLLGKRERVKRDVRELALKGWRRNIGDEDWSIRGED